MDDGKEPYTYKRTASRAPKNPRQTERESEAKEETVKEKRKRGGAQDAFLYLFTIILFLYVCVDQH